MALVLPYFLAGVPEAQLKLSSSPIGTSEVHGDTSFNAGWRFFWK
jgi:hypothetical protein